MKRAALLAISVFASLCTAASWDVTKGPFTVFTFTFASGAGVLPGVPSGGPVAWHTTIFIKCADPTVNAVRVLVSWKDSGGTAHTASLLTDLINGGYGAVSVDIPQDQITEAPHFIELREGASY